jgi:multicomponent Na+:H+ antiporter subunit C
VSLLVATAVGVLLALGVFLLLRDNLVQVALGVAVISQAANLFLLSMGGLREGTGDLVPVLSGHGGAVPATADPVVQALVLTAIVISFGTTALALALTYRAYQENETMNVQRWR